MEFLTPTDICNRALQHCGAEMMDQALGFTEISNNARQVSFCYGKLRRAELRRNVWRFATRRAVLRPIDTNVLLLSPSLWSSGTTYFLGSLVTDASNNIWQSRIPNNLGNDPQNTTAWEPYFGPLTAMLYDSSQVYFAGEVVYTAPGDGTYNVYISMVTGNTLDPSLPNQWSISTVYLKNQVVQAFPAWSSGTTYTAGQTIVYTDGNIYTSLVAGNLNNIPPNTLLSKWALVPIISLLSLTVPANTSNPTVPAFSSPVAEWSQPTTYALGAVVMFNGTEYVSILASNTGNFPNAVGSTFWAAMTGGTQYMSLIDLNHGNNPANAPALWASGTTYAINNLVGGSDGVIYKSLANGNLGNNPTTDGGVHWQNTGVLNPWTTVFTQGSGNQQWLQIGGSASPGGVGLSELRIVYPLGTGPASQSSTRNIFRLPSGFLREAPQDPKAGSSSPLGAPAGLLYDDWEYEGNYIVSRTVNPIAYRFVADVTDVTAFDDQFCEGLAWKVALEVAPKLTQSSKKLEDIAAGYKLFMGEARLVNGIETGPTEPPEDDYIAARY
jgi:hypothetical protein